MKSVIFERKKRYMNSTVRKISIPRLVLACLLSLAAGSLGGLLAGNSFDTYSALQKPPLAPPGFIFPIVWTVLYLLMGAASYFVAEKGGEESRKALTTYAFYMVLNILWPTAFFKKGAILGALILLAGQLILIFACITAYRKIDKKAALFLIPTTLWSLFAFYLNLGFLLLIR